MTVADPGFETPASEHPVYVPERGWVASHNLKAGDELCEPEGGTSVVAATETLDYPAGITVYNIRVAESHTYFVRQEGSTAEPVWVHNARYSPAVPIVDADGEGGVLLRTAAAERVNQLNNNPGANAAAALITGAVAPVSRNRGDSAFRRILWSPESAPS